MPLISMKRLFYPKWWLQATGYFDTLKGRFGPDSILFAPSPAGPSAEAAEEQTSSSLRYYAGILLTSAVSCLVTLSLMHYYMSLTSGNGLMGAAKGGLFSRRADYAPIPDASL
eukprot:GDKI01048060.1.p1 GENE.GDKI01048060.1~~GDKI01048060.1.p1  ORF type:complete len:113 (-),score=15.53 GDKI01048060.1:259-597(-)